MKTCKTCKHWTPYAESGRWMPPHKTIEGEYAGGFCRCDKITEPMDDGAYASDALTYSYDEGGRFWTGTEFGCVHHKEY